MATTTPPKQLSQQQAQALPPRRGPLSHIVDALREDNRLLLLETLRRPYLPTTGGVGGGVDGPTGGGGTASSSSSSSVVARRQVLIFGSSDLRRVILRQVMDNGGGGSGRKDDGKKKRRGGNRKKNATMVEEEEEIVRDWNEELRSLASASESTSSSSSSSSSSGGDGGGREAMTTTTTTTATQIVGTHVLSPTCDGSVVASPYHDDNDDDVVASAASSPTTITYVLRGGGFDLPSLGAATAHRRRVLRAVAEGANNSSSSSSSSVYDSASRALFNPSSVLGTKQQQQQQQSGVAAAESTSTTRLFRFVFVPRMTEMERAYLNELGLVATAEDDGGAMMMHSAKNEGAASSSSFPSAGINSLESMPIDLIPLDDDVLSLELTGGCGSGVIDGTRSAAAANAAQSSPGVGDEGGANGSCMRHSLIEGCDADVSDVVARSLIKLQLLNRGCGGGESSSSLGGAIPRVQGLGPLATAVIDRMMTLRIEEERMEAEDEEDMDGGDEENDEAGNEVLGGQMQWNSTMNRNENIVNDAAEGVEITPLGSGGANDVPSSMSPSPSIQALLVIDRRIDLVTPMLTPLTYEGLVDDVLQIQVGGCVSVKKSIVEPDDDGKGNEQQWQKHQQETVLLPLNDSDPLYAEVRDKHVETFGSFLQNQAKALKESHSQFTNREAARLDLTEIHQFVKQIPVFTRNLRSLTNHIHIAELVKSAAEATSFRQRWQTERSMLESEPCYERLEDLIATGLEPPYRWLRLFCLQSLTSNGIKATRYDALRREVIQTYGYEYLIVLNDLEKAGFLRKRETFFIDSMATPYSTLRKALNLINPDVDPSNPEDIAYVSSGYAPMTVRWIEAAMRGYAGLDEAMKELPAAAGVGVGSGGGGGGRWVDVEQQSPPENLVEALKRKRGPSLGTLAKQWSKEASTEDKPVLLVYFVGGVTFMELAALRFLSRRPSFPYNIVCCTTEIVNGGTLLKSLSC